ncbi:hypothetical protein DSM104299_02008 [Baekduia alba]|uniref:hypothetical protein n=1 Tax=Baekduia alba TaxID=2997333 RepID=UPI00234115AE|nr:hypothetical protein [Baekduia alba]WCB93296.1 hypothetical protein DSM104299_02008 [Baekduia alba]
MTRRIRSTIVLAAVGSLALAGVAEAKTYKINAKTVGKQVGVKLSANITDPVLGKCTMTGKLVIPDTQQVWKCKGGTFRLIGHGTTGAANDAKGTWKVTGGTGKFKGASGKGTFAGKLSTAKFTYKGSIKV